jgi:hypothetical protein
MNVHFFPSTTEAYDTCEFSDQIKDGDVLVATLDRVAGFLYQSSPVAVSPKFGSFHTLDADMTPADLDVVSRSGDRYQTAAAEALRIVREQGWA